MSGTFELYLALQRRGSPGPEGHYTALLLHQPYSPRGTHDGVHPAALSLRARNRLAPGSTREHWELELAPLGTPERTRVCALVLLGRTAWRAADLRVLLGSASAPRFPATVDLLVWATRHWAAAVIQHLADVGVLARPPRSFPEMYNWCIADAERFWAQRRIAPRDTFGQVVRI